MEVGARVVMRTFRGLTGPAEDVRPDEDFWRLVGAAGTVVRLGASSVTLAAGLRPHVLVRFDADVRALGLACHNSVPNALWLCVDDLAAVQ